MEQQWEMIANRDGQGWAVERIHEDGTISRVLFMGEDDKELAEKFASWKNAGTHEAAP